MGAGHEAVRASSSYRAIEKIMQDDGDRCSICRRSFAHNCRTFGGVTLGGEAALVGECCKGRLKLTLGMGIYVERDYDGIFKSSPPTKHKAYSQQDIAAAVDAHRQRFDAFDKLGAKIAKKGGLPFLDARLHTNDTVWKADDAAWFKAHASRSHRLRPMLEGEREAMFGRSLPPRLPADHEYQVIVRQVEPGSRLRILFGRDLTMPIPDVEEVIHALFDIASGSKGGTIKKGQVAELAQRYIEASGKNGRPS
jgi:hypothetical protein